MVPPGGGEIAQNLFRLYLYFNEQLMDGNIKKEIAPVKQVRKLMAELRDAWKQIENTQVTSAPATRSGINIAG